MNSYRHFPITSATYELDEPSAAIGQRFATDVIPMGQVSIRSGKLVIGDPLLGMSIGENPWLAVAAGAYSAVLTRLLCLDRDDLEVPAYLSLILDPEEIEKRRQAQVERSHVGGEPWVSRGSLSSLEISDTGRMEEAEDFTEIDEHMETTPQSRSGVVAMVDGVAFESRMPDPLRIHGGWFERYFDGQSKDSWLKVLDDNDHLGAGIANISLPQGPDDWIEDRPSTIALAQMAAPGACQVLVEYAEDDFRHLNPIAVHIELGLEHSLQGIALKPAL